MANIYQDPIMFQSVGLAIRTLYYLTTMGPSQVLASMYEQRGDIRRSKMTLLISGGTWF